MIRRWLGKQGMIIMMLLLISPIIFAKDLGVIGQTYPIQEEDFLQFILRRLQNMQINGEWQKLKNQFSDIVKKHAERPLPVVNISRTISQKSWNYNPSITLPYDLQDKEGRIFAKTGTIINPLKYISIHKPMLFFNGDDPKQVAWATKLNRLLNGQTKLVLVQGSIIEQEKLFHQPIYFDQEGKLTTRFHIQHVPAMAVQEELHLKISEVLP